jgi:hypothetical protein
MRQVNHARLGLYIEHAREGPWALQHHQSQGATVVAGTDVGVWAMVSELWESD